MTKKTLLITGSDGLCGQAIQRLLIDKHHQDFYKPIYISHKSYDLRNENNVRQLFTTYEPEYIIHTAARVGGIGGNEAAHADFFHDNILMNVHMLHWARIHNVQKFIAFSSVCVFPDNLAILQEDKMHDGPVYASNFAYGHAKRMVDVQIQALKKQYGVSNYCSVIPGNIFGPNDNYNISHGHVIPSLIHKIYTAKKTNTDFVVWGDGRSLREFIYVDDLAKIVLNLLDLQTLPDRLIVSGPIQYAIKEIIDKLIKISGFTGNVVYDTTKPNGQRARPSDLSRFYSYFPHCQFIGIDEGLTKSYKWFEENYPNVRM